MSNARRLLLLDRFGEALVEIAQGDHDNHGVAQRLAAGVLQYRGYDGIYDVGDLVVILIAQGGTVRLSALTQGGALGTATSDEGPAVADLLARVLDHLRRP